MAVDVQRVHHPRIGLVNRDRSDGHRLSTIRTAAPVTLRGLLVGLGTGVLVLSSHQPGVASVTILGVLALGAALLSWDR